MRTEPQLRGFELSFELCADDPEVCRIARSCGADRIELCTQLSVDGLTPSHGLLRRVISESGLPVTMLIRPHAGNFVYSSAYLQVMRDDVIHGRSLGVSGFALGVLLRDGRVDQERTRGLVELAGPLEVTFHRAFDLTPDPLQALEDVIATGCRRVLTSGGAADVVAGAAMLQELVRQAAGRIEVAVGGGLRARDAARLVQQTQARHFHSSVRRLSSPAPAGISEESDSPLHQEPEYEVRPVDVRELVESLQRGAAHATQP